MNKAQAKKRIKELKGFYSHLASYVVVNCFLVALNLFTSPEYFWAFFPIAGWGIGLVLHAFHVFGTGSGWEERKLQELTGLRDTQDELERLTERTETLVTILSNINWEKIDPEFLSTRDNLKAAQDNIVRLRDETADDPRATRQEVIREIEKLEELVTGPRFQFMDLAQK